MFWIQTGQLLLQLEVPMDTVLAAAKMAHEKGTTVIFDPAPVMPLPEEFIRYIDVITPNETEASALVGFEVNNEDECCKSSEGVAGTRCSRSRDQNGQQRRLLA